MSLLPTQPGSADNLITANQKELAALKRELLAIENGRNAKHFDSAHPPVAEDANET